MFKNLFKSSNIENASYKDKEGLKLSKSLEKNIQLFQSIFHNDDTLILRNFENQNSDVKCCIFYIDGMVDNEIVNESIIQPVIRNVVNVDKSINNSTLEQFQNKVLFVNNIKKSIDINEIIKSILYGDTVFFLDG